MTSRVAAWTRLLAEPDARSPLWATFSSPPPTLRLAGEADESNYAELAERLSTAVAAGGSRLLVDVGGLDYCDLAGLRAIVSLPYWRPADGGPSQHLVLRHAPAAMRDTLSILGWDELPGLVLEDPS